MAGFIEFLGLLCTLGLYQAQLNRPFDSCPAVVNVELGVNALGMGTNRAQSDHELAGDLGPREIGLEQPEHFKLTLAERLDERLDE